METVKRNFSGKKIDSGNLEEIIPPVAEATLSLVVVEMKSIKNSTEKGVHRVTTGVWPLKFPRFEDVVYDVNDPVGGNRVAVEDLRMVDEVVEPAERVQPKLIPAVFLSGE